MRLIYPGAEAWIGKETLATLQVSAGFHKDKVGLYCAIQGPECGITRKPQVQHQEKLSHLQSWLICGMRVLRT
jgi:hypothetical protein